MRTMLCASDILENVRALRGFTTNRELADFFGVGPSSITDWVKRKGDAIPAKRLAEVSRRYSIRWQWLAYGEAPPYEATYVDSLSGIEVDPGLRVHEAAVVARSLRRRIEEISGVDHADIHLELDDLAHQELPPTLQGPRSQGGSSRGSSTA